MTEQTPAMPAYDFVHFAPGTRLATIGYTERVPAVLGRTTSVVIDVTDPADWHPEHEGSVYAPDGNSGYDQDRTADLDDSHYEERTI